MSILGVILAIVIGILGLILEGGKGFIFGGLLGYCLGAIFQLTGQMAELKTKLVRFENILNSIKIKEQGKRDVPKPEGQTVDTEKDQDKARPGIYEPHKIEKEIPAQVQETELPVQKNNIPRPEPKTERLPLHSQQVSSIQQRTESSEGMFRENIIDKLVASVHRFFTDGNVVVKIGILITIFGVGFVLKYGYEQQWFTFPLELRFAGAGLLGLALVVFGWRLREKKHVYALLLQGGGIGIMYLTVFGATKFYSMIPISMAFAMMIALVVFSAILAILQNARQLAFFGAIGGFLAPVLLSTGSGNHVVLFSYYGLLNFGILAIAYYRSWRELNLLGFIFTFGIAGLWGTDRYTSSLLSTTEPFLVLYFLMYVAIAILFAFRQPPNLRGYIDSTLVFGVPIVVFGYQASMVHHIEYGIAFSALIMSAFYISLASLLWRRGAAGMRLLTESFLAMGVVFGSLAIPLALDGRWTSAAWAMEGAALIWVGIRQHRVLPRLFGVLLQFGAGYFFLQDWLTSRSDIHGMMFLNGEYLGGMIISLAALFSSYKLYKGMEWLRTYEIPLHPVLFIWGLIWWFITGLNELDAHISSANLLYASFAFVMFSLYLGYLVQVWKQWRMLRFPVLGHLYVMITFLWLAFVTGLHHPFEHYGWLLWPIAVLLQYWFLFRYSDEISKKIQQWQHIMTFWLILVLASWESAWLINKAIDGAHVWRDVMFALTPALIMLILFTAGKHIRWPVKENYKWYASHAAAPVMVILAIVAFGFGVLHEGNPWPVNYIPIVNPVDLFVAFLLYLLMIWRIRLEDVDSLLAQTVNKRTFNYAMAGLAFMWINGMVARTVHHWFRVSYDLEQILSADQFQGSISVIWTILALVVMVIASRRLKRHLWFVGLGLFIVVAAKLFLFDMSNANALTMALSITIVGIIAVVFGYFLSPLPPKKEESLS